MTKYLELCKQEKILQGISDMKNVHPGLPAQLICELKEDNIDYGKIFTIINEHAKIYMPKGYGLHYSNIPNIKDLTATFIGTEHDLRTRLTTCQDDRYFVVQILAVL